MITPTNEDLVTRWSCEEAPLLPLLHAFHDRDGYLTEESIRAVSDGLKIPIAEVFGTVTFYHHFAREAPGHSAARVCTGPVCRLLGSEALLQELPGATPMACAGRCDDGVPVLSGHRVQVGTSSENLTHTPSPLPPRRQEAQGFHAGDGKERGRCPAPRRRARLCEQVSHARF